MTFSDTGTLDNDVVHLHLEHRVVQRLLTRFRAQGFVHDDLSRACISHTRDPIPRVVLLGRVAVYGEGASRLHEQLITVAARLEEGGTKVKPFAAAEQDEAMRLLHEALQDHKLKDVSATVQEKLRTAAASHLTELRKYLERQGEAQVERAAKELTKRGEREAKDMALLIKEQRKRIEATIKGDEKRRQLWLQFDDDEKRQLEADRKHWARRLEALDKEEQSEPERIRRIYEVKATRVEPVGLVYLWPVTG